MYALPSGCCRRRRVFCNVRKALKMLALQPFGPLRNHPHDMWITLWTVWKTGTKFIHSLWKLWITLWKTVYNPVDIGG